MQMLGVEHDGTTTIKMTDDEAHELRDVLAAAVRTGASAPWKLQRLLAYSHGETEK